MHCTEALINKIGKSFVKAESLKNNHQKTSFHLPYAFMKSNLIPSQHFFLLAVLKLWTTS